MQRAADQEWEAWKAAEEARRHPLRSRLERRPASPRLVAALTAPLPPADLPSAAEGERRPQAAAPATTQSSTRAATKSNLKPTRSRRAGSAIGYGLLGFLLGAIFWHFIGFWDFVGQVMFRGPSTDQQISQAPAPVKLKERVGGAAGPLAVVIEPSSCSTLQLDRDSGQTHEVPCESETLPLRSLRLARKEDLWVTATQRIQQATSRGWAMVTVEKPSDRPEQVSAAAD